MGHSFHQDGSPANISIPTKCFLPHTDCDMEYLRNNFQTSESVLFVVRFDCIVLLFNVKNTAAIALPQQRQKNLLK